MPESLSPSIEAGGKMIQYSQTFGKPTALESSDTLSVFDKLRESYCGKGVSDESHYVPSRVQMSKVHMTTGKGRERGSRVRIRLVILQKNEGCTKQTFHSLK